MKESSLLEVYKHTRGTLEKMFLIDRKTTRHAPAQMRATFAKLARYMQEHRAHEYVRGRGSHWCVPHAIDRGMYIFQTAADATAIDMETGAVVDGTDDEWADLPETEGQVGEDDMIVD